jgi:hypothetical protein
MEFELKKIRYGKLKISIYSRDTSWVTSMFSMIKREVLRRAGVSCHGRLACYSRLHS